MAISPLWYFDMHTLYTLYRYSGPSIKEIRTHNNQKSCRHQYMYIVDIYTGLKRFPAGLGLDRFVMCKLPVVSFLANQDGQFAVIGSQSTHPKRHDATAVWSIISVISNIISYISTPFWVFALPLYHVYWLSDVLIQFTDVNPSVIPLVTSTPPHATGFTSLHWPIPESLLKISKKLQGKINNWAESSGKT